MLVFWKGWKVMQEKKKKNRNKYFQKHEKENYRRCVALIRKDDAALINKINSVSSINDYVYNLIKRDVYKDVK